jgi:hypothetical protein
MAAVLDSPNTRPTTLMQTGSQRVTRNLNTRLLNAKQISFRLVDTKLLQRPCGDIVEV